MNLDPRIIEGKRVLTPFDITEAKQFDGNVYGGSQVVSFTKA